MRRAACLLVCVLAAPVSAGSPPPESLRIHPTEVTLRGPSSRQALLATGGHGIAGESDLTRAVEWRSLDPKVAEVTAAGIVLPRGDGSTEIVARLAGREARVPVTVRGANEPSPVDFRTDVIAALSRGGCNSGACHGSPQGKNQFRMSLRGYDPALDIRTLTRENNGRRVHIADPDASLLLLKGAGRVSHGGGALLSPSDPSYTMLRRWIAEGCRDAGPAPGVKLEVFPARRRLHADAPTQQITVRAVFADGSSRDVTDLAVFSVNDPVAAPATVTPGGLVTLTKTAEVSVLVRYLDQVTAARLSYVRTDPEYKYTGPAPANFVDEHAFGKMRELQLNPAPLAPDEVFLRRVYLDLTGGLPSADDAKAFLDSKDPKKREQLVDRLLMRDEFAYFWALKWADILRGSPVTVSERGVHSFHRWLVKAVAEDRPVDQFARELLTSSGNTLHKPAASFYRVSRTPDDCAETFAQVFLGVRVQCAKCHNHPFEAMTQTDYYGLAAFFARVQRKQAGFMLDDEVIYTSQNGDVQHPLTRKTQEPIAFGTPIGPLTPDDDRRAKLADWLARKDNPYFARSIANRVVFHMLGKGVVDPVDDFRDTNPPSNPELLQALADEFVKSGYRMKPLIRAVALSNVYALDVTAPPQSAFAAKPDRYFVKAAVRMLSAEQVVDAVSMATGVPERFAGFPAGTKAIELPEGGFAHPFLQAFSKPVRDLSCECAREEDPSLPQMLHLMNNSGIAERLKSPDGRVSKWLKENRDPATLTELIYLSTLSRRPTKAEVELVQRHLASVNNDKAACFRDLQYALLNSADFLLRR